MEIPTEPSAQTLPVPPVHSGRRGLIIGIAIIVLAAAAGGGYLWYLYNYQLPQTGSAESPLGSTLGQKRSQGNIYLTLQNDEPGYIASLMAYNIAQDKLALLLNDGKVNITGSVSPDRKEMTYVASPLAKNGPVIPQVAILNLTTGQQKTVTHSLTVLKREPKWSPNGEKIAFAARMTDVDGASENPDDWKVYVTDLLGNETLVGIGTHPHWTPDGKQLMYLRKDGLHLYDIATKKDRLVWGIHDGAANISMTFDISKDGQYIAWSNASHNEIRVVKVSSWMPFAFTDYRTIQAHAFWVTFSPGSSALAAEEVDWGATPTNPRLVIYNLNDSQSRTLITLGKYSQKSIFISDWK